MLLVASFVSAFVLAVMAFILGGVSCFVLYWLTLQDHYSSISRGVVDLRVVVFFLSVAVAAVIVSILIMNRAEKR